MNLFRWQTLMFSMIVLRLLNSVPSQDLIYGKNES